MQLLKFESFTSNLELQPLKLSYSIVYGLWFSIVLTSSRLDVSLILQQ